MDKLCCCNDQSLPDISINFNCACCESRLEERVMKDTVDLDTVKAEVVSEKKEIESDTEEDTCCCCFRPKRHAKSKNRDRQSDGRKT